MILYWPSKDTDEVVDYSVDWSRRVDQDRVVFSQWVIDSPADDPDDGLLTMGAYPASFTDTTATVWLAGGTLGKRYFLTNTVDTAVGRIFQQTVSIMIEEH